jgi:hypothetical protein
MDWVVGNWRWGPMDMMGSGMAGDQLNDVERLTPWSSHNQS